MSVKTDNGNNDNYNDEVRLYKYRQKSDVQS